MTNSEKYIWGNKPLRLKNNEIDILQQQLSLFFNDRISKLEWLNKGKSGAQIFYFELNGKKNIIKLQTKQRCLREEAGYFQLSRTKVQIIKVFGIVREYEIYGLISDFYEGEELHVFESKIQHSLICENFNDFFIGEEVYFDKGDIKKKLWRFYVRAKRVFDKLNFTMEERNKINVVKEYILNYSKQIVKVHGDPSLKNVIVNNGKVHVIDYGNFSVLPLESQKARFLNSLLLNKESILCKTCRDDLLRPIIVCYQICDVLRRIDSDYYDLERVKQEYRLCQNLLRKISS